MIKSILLATPGFCLAPPVPHLRALFAHFVQARDSLTSQCRLAQLCLLRGLSSVYHATQQADSTLILALAVKGVGEFLNPVRFRSKYLLAGMEKRFGWPSLEITGRVIWSFWSMWMNI
jgi:hypothetical protein